MATPGIVKHYIEPFWDDEFTRLNYVNEPFNDWPTVQQWLAQGFANQFTGDMCDMRSAQPSWNHRFVEHFAAQGWHDVGTSYYRMMPGTVLPTHRDTYRRYIDLFGLCGQEHRIRRAVVFLQSWQTGHYGEYGYQPWTQWQAGDTVIWNWDEPHMAANLGTEPRYTLQVTGHI